MSNLNQLEYNNILYDLEDSPVREMISSIESSSTLSNSYSSGDIFILNNKLYKALVPLSSGTSVIVNTNIEEINIQELLTKKADLITKTVSDDILTITDGAEYPVSDLIVNIEPVQDLHGYDNPWPAGGGTNKYDASTKTSGLLATASGLVQTNANWEVSDYIPMSSGSFSLSWNSTTNYYQANVCAYDSTKTFIENSGSTWTGYAYTHTFTAPENTAYVRVSWSFVVSGTEYPRTNVRVNVGSSDLGYAPYSNICPITGWTENVVTRTGKNLLPNTTAWKRNNSGNYSNTSDSSTTRIRNNPAFSVPYGANSYYLSGIPTGLSILGVYCYDKSQTRISDATRSGTFFTTPSDTAYIAILLSGSGFDSTTEATIQNSSMMLELGSSATDYEAYSGTSVTIDLGGTRYGGTLDVVNGTLTMTHEYFNVTSMTRSNDHQFYKTYGTTLMADATGTNNIICDRLPTLNSIPSAGTAINGVNTNAGMAFIVHTVNAYATATDMMTAMGGQINFVCRLATPLTYTLTAQQLSLLVGTNNVWANTGDIENLTYLTETNAGIGKTIDARLRETGKEQQSVITKVENGMVATKLYNSGDLIIVNNQLLRTTTGINIGSNLVVGSNVEEVDLEEIIDEKVNTASLGTLATKNDVASDNKNYVRKNQAWSELVDPVKTASGDIVTVTDALAEPLAGLTIGIDPVQDLHGYDNPWPAGGGKNIGKLSAGAVSSTQNNTVTYSDTGATVTATDNYGRCGWSFTVTEGETYTVSYKALGVGYQRLVYATETGTWTTSGDGYLALRTVTTAEASYSYTFTATSSGIFFFGAYTVAGNYDGTQYITVSDFQLEKGSSATSYAPYENVCPITGHTQAVVTRTGGNMFDWSTFYANSTKQRCTATIASDGTITATSNAVGQMWIGLSTAVDGMIPNNAFTVKASQGDVFVSSGFGTETSYYEIDSSNKVISISFKNIGTSYTITNASCVKLGFRVIVGTSSNIGDTVTGKLQLERASSASSYSAYSGTSVTIDLGGTRYGGTLDVVNGTMTVTHAIVDLGTLTWTYASNRMKYFLNGIAQCASNVLPDMIAEQRRVVKWTDGLSSNHDGIAQNPNYNNGAEIATYATDSSDTPNGLLVYPLATPLTVTLDPHTLQLLAGENVVWASTGDTSLTYWTPSAELLLKAIDARIASVN